jgi:hypothetical protein
MQIIRPYPGGRQKNRCANSGNGHFKPTKGYRPWPIAAITAPRSASETTTMFSGYRR